MSTEESFSVLVFLLINGKTSSQAVSELAIELFHLGEVQC